MAIKEIQFQSRADVLSQQCKDVLVEETAATISMPSSSEL